MDFESIISFALLFLFFIVPSVLKRMGKNKKSASPSAFPAKKKTSFLGKLGEQIQAFMRDLEEQAQKAKQEQEGSAWDHLDDGADIGEPLPSSDAYFEAESHLAEEPEFSPVSQAKINKNDLKPEEKMPIQPMCLAKVQGKLPNHALQQAVVWSEVLGKPVALRRD